jgi:hypothetical protein
MSTTTNIRDEKGGDYLHWPRGFSFSVRDVFDAVSYGQF